MTWSLIGVQNAWLLYLGACLAIVSGCSDSLDNDKSGIRLGATNETKGMLLDFGPVVAGEHRIRYFPIDFIDSGKSLTCTSTCDCVVARTIVLADALNRKQSMLLIKYVGEDVGVSGRLSNLRVGVRVVDGEQQAFEFQVDIVEARVVEPPEP